MLLQKLLRAFMFSSILGMFGGLFASLVLMAVGLYQLASYPVLAVAIAVTVFVVRVFVVGYDNSTPDSPSNANA
ncbi:MAG: hypothetical protein CMF62_05015 [Magnetococcales bacterium]|jgi:hypothetical protein|nr:hypothetical protein [Magnetococcales bacterium]|tara:strand:+ start:38471 stop:38692 length:222 start_codon:yes stop_codon:yes gene_type:complete